MSEKKELLFVYRVYLHCDECGARMKCQSPDPINDSFTPKVYKCLSCTNRVFNKSIYPRIVYIPVSSVSSFEGLDFED